MTMRPALALELIGSRSLNLSVMITFVILVVGLDRRPGSIWRILYGMVVGVVTTVCVVCGVILPGSVRGWLSQHKMR